MREAAFRDGLLYRYRATPLRPLQAWVRDGDTFAVDLDLGLGVRQTRFMVRALGYDAPETTGATREAGLAARAWLIRLLDSVERVYLQTVVDGRQRERVSFDRYLARVWLPDGEDGLLDLAALAIAGGYGVAA